MADSSANETLSPGAAIQDTLNNVVQQVVDFAPEVLGATLVLLAGYIVAKILSLSIQKLAQSLDSLLVKVWSSNTRKREKFLRTYPKAVSKAVFWIVILFFIAVASNILGLDLFSGWMQRIFSYLPGIITGILIIIGGLILGNFSRSAIISAVDNEEIQQRVFLAKLVQVIIIFCAILIGLDQIGLNINFLSNIVVTVIGILLGGAALAFGLGARGLMANIIATRSVRRHCEIGDHIIIDGNEGELIEIGQDCLVMETAEGKTIIPAELFHKKATIIRSHRS